MTKLAEQKSSKLAISAVVPVLNELVGLPELFETLQNINFDQIIVVDGGSNDGTWQWLQEHVQVKPHITVMQCKPGRARQMNQGAKNCSAGTILFLHADTLLPNNAEQAIIDARKCQCSWGRFDVSFPRGIANEVVMRIIAFFINLRSRLSGIATGDQAIFVNADLFQMVGGFVEMPLMEDIVLSKQLKKQGRPYCSKLQVTTSPRRWLHNGIIKTVLMMWGYRLAFFIGVPADVLANRYRNVR